MKWIHPFIETKMISNGNYFKTTTTRNVSSSEINYKFKIQCLTGPIHLVLHSKRDFSIIVAFVSQQVWVSFDAGRVWNSVSWPWAACACIIEVAADPIHSPAGLSSQIHFDLFETQTTANIAYYVLKTK